MGKRPVSSTNVVAEVLRLAAEGKLNVFLREHLQAEERLLKRLESFEKTVAWGCQKAKGQEDAGCWF